MEFNSDFKYDLEFGKLEGESWFHNLVTNKKIEVKCDRQAEFTGNVFIEFKSRGKLSGLATTESDYYVYKYNDNQAFIIQTDYLKKRCKELVRRNKAKIIKGGDNNSSEGLLISIKDLATF